MASCCASTTSPCTKRHRAPYGHRPPRENDRQTLVLYEEGWSCGSSGQESEPELVRVVFGEQCLPGAKLIDAVSKLALVAVRAAATSYPRAAELSLQGAGRGAPEMELYCLAPAPTPAPPPPPPPSHPHPHPHPSPSTRRYGMLGTWGGATLADEVGWRRVHNRRSAATLCPGYRRGPGEPKARWLLREEWRRVAGSSTLYLAGSLARGAPPLLRLPPRTMVPQWDRDRGQGGVSARSVNASNERVHPALSRAPI